MSTQEKKDERTVFKISLEENEPFNPIAESKYISSNDLGKMVSELFKNVFADFEGCLFEISQSGEPTFSLIFNHGKYDEDARTAVEIANAKGSGSSVLDRTRTRDRQLTEGDRYYLTEDGKDVVKALLTPKAYNNGNINWRNVVVDYVDRNMGNMYMQNQVPQFTKVNFIDLRNLCKLLFGETEDGDQVDYQVLLAGSITPNQYQAYPGMQVNMNYMLNITRASAKQVKAIYEKLGFGVMGTQIIR